MFNEKVGKVCRKKRAGVKRGKIEGYEMQGKERKMKEGKLEVERKRYRKSKRIQIFGLHY